MPEIVLTTLNAKYIHAAFGVRYLFANLGELRARAGILEFDINQRPIEIAEALLASNPTIIGFGVYIWNVTETTEVIAIIKRVKPGIRIIVGGPEVSFETDQQQIVALADFVITGEADLCFVETCRRLLAGEPPENKLIPAALPDPGQIALPYGYYDEKDVAHRIIYVEASRGCPFTCEFCLSSLDVPVRQFPLPRLLEEFQRLLDRGVQHFKFVDRTFNLNLAVSKTLLEFFLERLHPGLFLHFEMIPDRLPEALRAIISKFPPGALQFEIGVQSFNEEVCRLISRRQDVRKLEENFHFLRQQTGVHIHADLIAGLPGETLESFGAGFDRLIGLRPHEIQVGILKRLRGTPIVRHDQEWAMSYNSHPPYEILQNKLLDFPTLQRLRRFSRYWDLVGNSGNFVESTPLLWHDGASPFSAFLQFSDWLFGKVGKTDSIALVALGARLFEFLTRERQLPAASTAEILLRDYQRGGRRYVPQYLREFVSETKAKRADGSRVHQLKRQARHLETRSFASSLPSPSGEGEPQTAI